MKPATLRRRGLLAGGTSWASGAALAQGKQKLRIVIFAAPSLGAFLPPIIKAGEFDAKNGLDITFVERTPDAYALEFNTGEFQLGGSGAPLTIGLADLRGVTVTYLLNLFDYWGALVTTRPEIRSVADLAGEDVAAARGTTNWTMFLWFARKMGADPAKFAIINTTTAGLITYAMADRAAAVQLWEPAYTILKARNPDVRMLDLQLEGHWKAFSGSAKIPYLGVAAQQDWVKQNFSLVPMLHAAYRDAAAWLTANPDAGAKLISPKGAADEQAAIAALVRANDRLRMNVQPAGQLRRELEFVYRAGMEVGFLSRMPSAATIHDGPAG